MTIHPARSIPFTELRGALLAANDNGDVTRQVDGSLELYTYSKSCVYDSRWNPITTMARGLILDAANDNVVATPFPKFFNYGERPVIPNVPFEVFEKLDGSLIIMFWHNGQWRAATKGSFNSDQALAAQKLIDAANNAVLIPGHTYLAEYVGPQNRVVVHYPNEELVLLSAYFNHGAEYDYEQLATLGQRIGWRCAKRHHYNSFSELVAAGVGLPATQEGFVVRFINGYRLKIKGDEYCRLHRCISNVTPLAIWEAMVACNDLDAMRRELPEEFWVDFDCIRGTLEYNVEQVMTTARYYAFHNQDRSDKELGLILHTIPDPIRGLIFPLRKHGEQKVRAMALKSVRPKGNRLEGYRPSGAMQRVEREAT